MCKPDLARTIFLMDEQPPTCSECGRRIDLHPSPIDEDEDGPIYEGSCPVHGRMLFQDDVEGDA